MKDIKDYEGLYAVTSCGKVWSYRSQKFLTPTKTNRGYLRIGLHKNGKQQTFFVHRLVAETYLPNPTGLPQVNHKDENPLHNYLNNLEWCDAKYNINYGSHNQKIQKKVRCVELNRIYNSITEAANDLGLNGAHITNCCKGNRKTHGGYHWHYI